MLERMKKVLSAQMPDVDMSSVTESTNLFTDLHLDSLGMMMFAMALEDEFKVKFDDVPPFSTVGDVVNYISSKKHK